MSVDERARHDLHQQLEANLGASAADTLMGLLPPVGWADVATKSDIALLDARLNGLESRFEGLLQTGLAGLRTEMAAQTRNLMFALVGAAVSFGGLVLAAAQLG